MKDGLACRNAKAQLFKAAGEIRGTASKPQSCGPAAAEVLHLLAQLPLCRSPPSPAAPLARPSLEIPTPFPSVEQSRAVRNLCRGAGAGTMNNTGLGVPQRPRHNAPALL